MRIIQTITKFILLFSIAAIANAAPVIYTETKLNITVTKDQPQFVIKLQSNPSTGYSWFLRQFDKNLVETVSHVYQGNANKRLVGAGGVEVWVFRMKQAAFTVPEHTTIQFEYARPWEKTPVQKLSFGVTTLK